MADNAAGEKAAGGLGQRRQLHVAYGNALIAARGYSAPETTEAFAIARESAFGDKGAPERLAADWGLWVGSLARGELPAMRAHAETFLGDVETRFARSRSRSPRSGTHALVRRRVRRSAGTSGRALALFQSGRNDDLAFRFGPDAGVAAMIYLALTLWPVGDIERAVSLVGAARARIASLAHIFTRGYANMHTAMFELMRGTISRAAPNAAELARLAREHDLPDWRAFGVFLEGLAVAQAGGGLEDMRRGVELLREQSFSSGESSSRR